MKIAESYPKRAENAVEKEKLLVTSNFSFFHSVFKRLVLQTHKYMGLFGKGLRVDCNFKDNLKIIHDLEEKFRLT